MSLNRLFVIIGLAAMMVTSFQNCQKAKMTAENSEVDSLQAVNENDFDLPPESGPSPSPNPNPNPNPTNPEDEDKDCRDASGLEEGDRDSICAIGVPGQSDRVGITVTDELIPEHDNNQDKKLVCMTKYACEQIASKAFGRSHPMRYGWCKGKTNKNVKYVSDAVMQQLVDKYIQANL